MSNDPSAGDQMPPGTGAEAAPAPGGETPPPYGPPPPATPPPSGPGVAGRYGLVRPMHGRYVAGVCAAVARVTNTDPVLWRVLVAVLTLFGGIGLLLYLLGWLLIPAEGDSASPLEALLGRGQSTTSPLNVILITILAVLAFLFVVTDGFRVAVLGAVAVIAALVLFGRNNTDRPGLGDVGPARPASDTARSDTARSDTARSDAPASGTPGVPYASASPPGPASVAVPPPPPPAPPSPPAGYPPPPPGGYRPPFAPHGPYASPPPPQIAVRRPPRPPKPPRQPSRLGRIVISLMCLALGTVAVIDLGMGEVPASAYFAVALAVVGLGLLIGAWLGRARWLIAVGLVLAAVLGIASVAENDRFRHVRDGAPVYWQPASIAEIDPAYRLDFGNATLDLRDVDFAAATDPVRVDLRVDFGNMQVLLPPDVDLDITADVGVGEATVLGERWGGIDTRQRAQDTGPDGPGGGKLVLTADINAGNLEVRR